MHDFSVNATSNPNTPIVFEAHSSLDNESILSALTYLRFYYDVKNRVYLYYRPDLFRTQENERSNSKLLRLSLNGGSFSRNSKFNREHHLDKIMKIWPYNPSIPLSDCNLLLFDAGHSSLNCAKKYSVFHKKSLFENGVHQLLWLLPLSVLHSLPAKLPPFSMLCYKSGCRN